DQGPGGYAGDLSHHTVDSGRGEFGDPRPPGRVVTHGGHQGGRDLLVGQPGGGIAGLTATGEADPGGGVGAGYRWAGKHRQHVGDQVSDHYHPPAHRATDRLCRPQGMASATAIWAASVALRRMIRTFTATLSPPVAACT